MVKWKRQGAKLCVEYCHVYGRNTGRLYRDTPVERVCACAVPGEMHKKHLLVVPGEGTEDWEEGDMLKTPFCYLPRHTDDVFQK